MNMLSRWLRSMRSTRSTNLRAGKKTLSLARRFKPRLSELEDRSLPSNTIVAAFGAGPGGAPEVTVRFDDGARMSFLAFDPAFHGGVSVVLGHVTGSTIPDVIVGAGHGGFPLVEVFDGADLVSGQVVNSATFMAFPSSFHGGVTLTAGPVNGTSHDDVVVAAGPGGGPEVEIFDGAHLAQGRALPTAAFFAFPASFSGGVTAVVGKVDGTNHDDVIVGAGPGGGPEVEVIDGAALASGHVIPTVAFFAFPANFSGGVTLAAGPVNGTGHDDIVVGAGPGGGPEVEVIDGASAAKGSVIATAALFAFPVDFHGGVAVAVASINCTSHDDVVVAAGFGGGPEVKVLDGAALAQGIIVAIDDFMAFPIDFHGGVQLVVGHVPGACPDLLFVLAGLGGGPQVDVFAGNMLAGGDCFPVDSFFAFSPAFTGGVDAGTTFSDCLIGDFFIDAGPSDTPPAIAADIYDPSAGFNDGSFDDTSSYTPPDFGGSDTGYDAGNTDSGSTYDPGGGYDGGF